MKKIVVISQGFISSYLIKRLKELKHQVTVYHHGEKMDFKGVDYIFYTSSYGNHYHQTDEYKIFKANVYDYMELLKLTRDVEYRGLIYFSTSSVNLPVQTNYSESKYIGEIIGKKVFKRFNKPIIAVRPYSVYGVGEADFRFIPTIISHLKSGESMPLTEGTHDWIHVEDFVEALIKIMDKSLSFGGKTISIGTGKQTSNHEVVKILEKISGKKLKVVETPNMRPYDNSNWVADTTIIKSLGWKQNYTLEEGLKKVWEG